MFNKNALSMVWLDSLLGGRASLALPRAILRVAAEKAGVRKNARFAHIMVNFGLVVREKRFSTHETVLRIRHGSIILAHSVWVNVFDARHRVFPTAP